MRLIDADKLADYICDACGDTECDRSKNAHCVERDFAVKVAKDAPTIEAEPVRHGHWEKSEEEPGDFCSICGRETHDRHDEFSEFNGMKVIALCLPRYCGYCGARMDGEEDA